jgi:hypothetical protein
MDEKASTTLTLNMLNPWSKILVDALLPFVTVKSYRKGIRLSIQENGEPVCRMIVSGTAGVYRALDHLLIVTAPTSSIVGLGGQNGIYILTSESCKIATLTLAEFHRYMEELGLWETLAKCMIMSNKKLLHYSEILSAPTAYQIICNQLLELMREPLATREKIAVERYIRDKTHLSRSSIMKILADLRVGGYVTIENGRLQEIHYLPQKY